MTLILDGLKLMFVGMGMVFAFLTVIVLWILLSAKLSVKFAHLLPDDVPAAPRRKAKAPAPGSVAPASASGEQGVLAAVVGAAVQAYRRDRNLH